MNPELLRNLWQEFSVRRLIAMPLVLAILFAAPLLREQPKPPLPQTLTVFESPFPDAGTSLVVTGMQSPFPMGAPPNLAGAGGIGSATLLSPGAIFSMVIGLLLFLWGTRLAADSLFAEVAGRTWDSQRSSAIGPWRMTIGKLFGSTAYVWYGAVFCIAFSAYLQFYSPSTIISIVLAGLWTQSLALFVALLLLRMAPDRTRFRVTLAQAVLLPVAAILFVSLSGSDGISSWYIFTLPSVWVLPISLALAVGWTIVGVYQLMRAELQFSAQPSAWIGFLAAFGAYAGGFGFRPGFLLSAGAGASFLASLERSLLLAAIAIVALAPLSALLSPPQLLPLHRLVARAPFQRRILSAIPPWMWPVGFGAALMAGAAILRGLGAETAFFGAVFEGPAMLAAVLLLLFALRDIGLLHLLSLNPDSRRGLMTTIVILAVSYIALPTLAKVTRASDLAFVFRPDFFTLPVLAAGAGLAEAVILWLLAARTFRQLVRVLPAVVLTALVFAGQAALAAPMGTDSCPRISAHQMFIEAGLVFEGRLLSQGPPPECATIKAACGQEVLQFQVDRVFKGPGRSGTRIVVRRTMINGRAPLPSDPRLAVPETGLFALSGNAQAPAPYDEEQINGYFIDECLLGIPPDMRAEAVAYSDKRASLQAAADSDATNADAVAALADHLLRYRDPTARHVLNNAILAFPESQAIRAEYIFVVDPGGMMSKNYFFWNNLLTSQPGLRHVLATDTKPDPADRWVRLLAIRTRGRLAEEGSPLHDVLDFSGYLFIGLHFADAPLHGANLTDVRITNSDLRGSDLTGADLRWAEFDNVDLSFAQLSDANLTEWNPATRNGVVLLRRIVTVGTMPGPFNQMLAGQYRVKLLRATLDRARMERATLVGADLRQASLKQAILREADLRQADLRGADLSGADLTGAMLDDARFDCRTRWPDSRVPPARSDPASDTALCRESLVVRQ